MTYFIQQDSKRSLEDTKQEYLGDSNVIKVRLWTLRHNFGKLVMGDKKYVQSYLSKLTEILSQMRYYGQNISSEDVIS